MKLVSKKRIFDCIQEQRYWKGYIAPNKVNKRYVATKDSVGVAVLIQTVKRLDGKEETIVILCNAPYSTEFEFNKFIDDYKSEHCNEEQGLNLKFWELD
ncbi:hypothetical protein COF68_06165 [Bacillus toyonensis]|uniref:hypothetical protein n=1 Tax=Bacillus toyonensis TaxID=155322 RepID=UPI000BFD2AAF|nr:hypothetical protein [Bacillus toyonensis]PHE64418.1 hypothetical protein COF68_06165 [Bacillus toyonensis]